MDYLQYNNAARAIARAAAFDTATTFDDTKKAAFKREFFHPITKLYEPTLESVTKNTDKNEVTVTIKLQRTTSLVMFDFLGFPPEELKPIVYIMPVEKATNTSE